MPLTKKEKEKERLCYLLNKLDKACGNIRNEWKNYLGYKERDSVDSCIHTVEHCQELENWCIHTTSELPSNDCISVCLESCQGKQLLGQNGNTVITTPISDEMKNNENFQWILEPVEERKQDGKITWFTFFIKNKATEKYLSSTNKIFPYCSISLSETPISWEIGITRFVIKESCTLDIFKDIYVHVELQ